MSGGKKQESIVHRRASQASCWRRAAPRVGCGDRGASRTSASLRDIRDFDDKGLSTTLPRSGSRVRIPSPAPVISSMKLIGCDASQVTNKAPDSLSGGTLGGTKAVPRSLKRYSNKPSPTVLTTSPGRLYEADQPGPKRAKQVTRQQGHGPTGPPGSITA